MASVSYFLGMPFCLQFLRSVLIIIIMPDEVPRGGRVLCGNSSETEGLYFRYIASIFVNWPVPVCKLGHAQDTDIKRHSLLDGRTVPACVCQSEGMAHILLGTQALGVLCFNSISPASAAAKLSPELYLLCVGTVIPNYLYADSNN
jgi:hypothetical protein